jgi:hypothetical protein
MPILSTKFIYQMYNIAAMDVMEQSYNMDAVKNTPRKGIYSNDDQGWKAFNNLQQTSMGFNGYRETENDANCKNRYVMVSVTALEDNSNLDLGLQSQPFKARPVLKVVKSGATSLTLGAIALTAMSILAY